MSVRTPAPLTSPHWPAHRHSESGICSRRDALKTGLFGCGAYLGFVLSGLALSSRRAYAATPRGEIVLETSFARIEKIREGVWAVISTPAGGKQTFSNGGIIAGKEAVVTIEGFMTPEGARFVADAAKTLTGREPDHVIVTHFHADHTSGLGGYLGGAQSPKLIATEKTRDLLLEGYTLEGVEADERGLKSVKGNYVLPNTVIAEGQDTIHLDLGGQKIRLQHRIGHTPSDLTIELEDPHVVFCGDLFFNQLFPYFGSALPSKLSATCRDLIGDKDTIYIPGHGPIASPDDQIHYLDLLGYIEEAARDFHRRGIPADEAWKEFTIPSRLGEWALFRPDVAKFAFQAWEKELGG